MESCGVVKEIRQIAMKGPELASKALRKLDVQGSVHTFRQ